MCEAKSPSFLVPALLMPHSRHHLPGKSLCSAPSTSLGCPPRADTHSQAEAERTSGAPSVQLNTPLLLPQGAQALAEPMGSAL